jgi:hypothetical protein
MGFDFVPSMRWTLIYNRGMFLQVPNAEAAAE